MRHYLFFLAGLIFASCTTQEVQENKTDLIPVNSEEEVCGLYDTGLDLDGNFEIEILFSSSRCRMPCGNKLKINSDFSSAIVYLRDFEDSDWVYYEQDSSRDQLLILNYISFLRDFDLKNYCPSNKSGKDGLNTSFNLFNKSDTIKFSFWSPFQESPDRTLLDSTFGYARKLFLDSTANANFDRYQNDYY